MKLRGRYSRRVTVVALVGVVALAAVFAAGTMVGRATADEDETISAPISRDLPGTLVAPGMASRGGGANASGAAKDAIGGAPDSTSMSIGYGCPAPLGPVIAGATIDPAKAGLVARFPGAGWTLLDVALRAAGDCDDKGVAAKGEPILSSSWRNDATGLTAVVAQRATSERSANVIGEGHASFWDGGSQFEVNVNGFHILPVRAADDVGGSGPASPAIAPAGNDPKARETVEAMVLALQPAGGLQCFYRETAGGWGDLAALGIGDPRPAVPAGFKENGLQVTTFTPPAAGCDTSTAPTAGRGFNAGWAKEGNASDFGYLFVSAFAVDPKSDAYPGQLNEYGANWSNGRLQFSVGMKSEKPVGEDAIRALATALDPNFAKACLAVQRPLAEGDLAALGLRKPKTPSGFKFTNEQMSAMELNGNCGGASSGGFAPSVSLNWTMEDGGGTIIQAGVNRQKGVSEPASGFISDNHVSWSDGAGNQYFVQGLSRGVSGAVAKELLVQVAKSLDPAFDETKLQKGDVIKGGGAAPPPVSTEPYPATR